MSTFTDSVQKRKGFFQLCTQCIKVKLSLSLWMVHRFLTLIQTHTHPATFTDVVVGEDQNIGAFSRPVQLTMVIAFLTGLLQTQWR